MADEEVPPLKDGIPQNLLIESPEQRNKSREEARKKAEAEAHERAKQTAEQQPRRDRFREALLFQLLKPATAAFTLPRYQEEMNRMDFIAQRLVREGMLGNIKAINIISNRIDGTPPVAINAPSGSTAAGGSEPVSATLAWAREVTGSGAEQPPKKSVH